MFQDFLALPSPSQFVETVEAVVVRDLMRVKTKAKRLKIKQTDRMFQVDEEASAAGSISSSDLQALNALGENVSITVVPKRKASASAATAKTKENDAEQSMVIEIDPASVRPFSLFFSFWFFHFSSIVVVLDPINQIGF